MNKVCRIITKLEHTWVLPEGTFRVPTQLSVPPPKVTTTLASSSKTTVSHLLNFHSVEQAKCSLCVAPLFSIPVLRSVLVVRGASLVAQW